MTPIRRKRVKLIRRLHLFLRAFPPLAVPATAVRCGDGVAAAGVIISGNKAAVIVVVVGIVAAIIVC